MTSMIFRYGMMAGAIVGVPLFLIAVLFAGHSDSPFSALFGYLNMLLALSLVFLAIKRRRDVALGGVNRFWPALALGLGVSAVASVIYVLAWEAALAVTHMDFAGDYANSVIARQRAHGASPEAMVKLVRDMEVFRRQYANPLYRVPMTLSEIFPVGVVVSLVSAAVLRNSRILPARSR